MPRSSRGVSLLGREVTGFMPNENMSVKNFAGKNYEWLRLNSAARDVKAWNTSGFGILSFSRAKPSSRNITSPPS